MFLARIIVGICFSAALALGVAGAAGGTPSPASPTEPLPTATPAPPEPALFDIFPWVNAKNEAREVIAKIRGTACATGVPGVGTVRLHFQLSVPSQEAMPGCGYEGAVVTFFVDGQQAPQTAIWHSGAMSQILEVIIGPPFARIVGVLHSDVRLTSHAIVSYVAGKACSDTTPHDWIGVGPDYAYGQVVYSGQQRVGCGIEGSEITFKLLDAQGNVIGVANQTGVWHAWDGVSDVQHLDLTFGPATTIAMPGTGGGTQEGASAWEGLPLALAVAGLAGVAGGLAVHRRVLQRRR